MNTRSRIVSRTSLGGVVVLVLAAMGALWAPPAAAASLTVNSTADVATNFGACGNAAQTTSSGSLREAICAANNAGAAASTITVAAGTYTLANGELQMGKVSGSNITLTGAGAANTIINGNNASRVFNLDPNLVGNVTTHISGVTITGGSDSTFGGGGIIAGSTAQPTGAPLDVLTVSNSAISGNHASGGSNTGGGIAFSGGNLTITNSTINNNTSNGAQASGVWYRAEGTGPGEGLTISGTTFSGNSVSTSSVKVGGALEAEVTRGSAAVFNISNSQFIGNTVTGSGAGTPVGGAIWAPSGILNVTESTFTGNSVSGGTSSAGGAIDVTGASATLHYNRFTGNTAASGQALSVESGSANATDNWWGCNTGPGTAGCDSVAGSPTVSPRLVLTATASPATVVGPNATSTITATLTQDSASAAVAASNLDAFAGLPVAFTDPLPSGATLAAGSANLSSGSASMTYNSQNTSGPGHVLATLDNGTATATVTVNRAPAITSGNTVSFTVGTAGTFTVTSTGYPAPAISETGTVPAGLTFTDNGNGTATLAGTPSTGSGGAYSLSLTASNGVNPNGTQTLTVTVNEAPAITTNPSQQSVNPGSSVSFTAAASGFPAPSVQWQRSTDGGGSFTDVAGATSPTYTFTAAAGDNASQYRAVFTNTVGSATSTAAGLTVNVAPSIDSADATSFAVGSAGSFTVTTSGVPNPTLTTTGTLPAWLGFTDNGDGTATLAGTPPAGSGGQYSFTINADNGTAPAASQPFTLTVNQPPAITSADHASFVLGTPGAFTVTTAGFPTPALSTAGTVPAWLTFTDNGDGTATLAGTPAASGSFAITIQASNGVPPDAAQNFVLIVRPTVTSVTPSTGPTTGGTTITIVGTGFTGHSTVLIGQGHGPGTGAVQAVVQHHTPTQLVALTPAGAKGTWNLFVHTPGIGTTAIVAADRFTYQLPRPTVTAVSPATGPTAGGTTITIDGTGFTPDSTVLIGQGAGPTSGALTAPVQTQTDNQITATTPPGTPGTWYVFVRTPGAGISIAATPARFTYAPA